MTSLLYKNDISKSMPTFALYRDMGAGPAKKLFEFRKGFVEQGEIDTGQMGVLI